MKFGFLLSKISAFIIFLVLVTAVLSAQEPPSAAGQLQGSPNRTGEPTLKISPRKQLESFEPPANEEYSLGAGDEITLDSPGRPELSGKHTVGPDGRITLPIAGDVHVADLSRAEAGKAIETALASFYSAPNVTVKIDKYSSNRVRVLGYVQHPGEILFEETPTLLDAISRAGLMTGPVNKEGVATSGNSIPETCTIYRGNDTFVQVKLRELLMGGDPLANLRLRRNDIIYVPTPDDSYVSVLGEVARPGRVALSSQMTLASVLSEAGCCVESAGMSPNIHIIQQSTNKDVVISYKKLMTLGGASEITLHSGDVIEVPKSGFFKATYILQRISPIATMVSLAALVGGG